MILEEVGGGWRGSDIGGCWRRVEVLGSATGTDPVCRVTCVLRKSLLMFGEGHGSFTQCHRLRYANIMR